ncbi:MAG: SH3 domain-containing protein [bacterium]
MSKGNNYQNFSDNYLNMFNSLKKMNRIIGDANKLKNISKMQYISNRFQNRVKFNTSFGLASIQAIQNSMKRHNTKINPFIGLSGYLNHIQKQQEIVSKSVPSFSELTLTDSTLKSIEQLKNSKIPDFSKSLDGLISIHEKHSKLTSIQQYLIQSFDLYINKINFNNEALKNISSDIQDLTDVVQDIEKKQEVTKEDIELINNKIDKQGTSNFIMFIIQIILSIILAVYNQPQNDEIKVKIEINESQRKEIENEFTKTLDVLCLEKREALVNVNLRTKPTKNSGKIGVVHNGQTVLVQDFNHKWIYIIFQDEEYILRSGWVFKKYFEKK